METRIFRDLQSMAVGTSRPRLKLELIANQHLQLIARACAYQKHTRTRARRPSGKIDDHLVTFATKKCRGHGRSGRCGSYATIKPVGEAERP